MVLRILLQKPNYPIEYEYVATIRFQIAYKYNIG